MESVCAIADDLEERVVGELLPKPELSHRQRIGEFGEVVTELTPESEVAWAEYLRELHFAKVALAKAGDKNE